MRGKSRWAWILVATALAAVVAGCDKQGVAPRPEVRQQQTESPQGDLEDRLRQAESRRDDLQAEADRQRGELDRLHKEMSTLEQENQQLRHDVQNLRDQVVQGEIPTYAYEAMALYFYRELALRHRPTQMVDTAGGQFALVEHGKPLPRVNSPAEVDWEPLFRWAEKHPVEDVQALHPFRGQPGYYVVDIDVTGGFYIRAIFHGHVLTDFMVGTEPFGLT